MRAANSFAALLVLVAGAVHAEDLVMPYTCALHHGLPQLSPATETTYHVIGSHVLQPFQSCPTPDEACDLMMIHKFIIMCDGKNVEWSVVARSARSLGIAMPDNLPAGFAPISRLYARLVLPSFYDNPSTVPLSHHQP